MRVPDLQSMHAAVARLSSGSVLDVRRCAVIVPTRAAGAELRRTLEERQLRSATAFFLSDFLTREDLYERLHAASRLPRRLTRQEREVLLRRAARRAAVEVPPPFSLRPGLIGEMLGFYDELRLRENSLDDFSRLITAPLSASAETDRGAERLLRQTEFLCAAYMEFERLASDAGALDEHDVRLLLTDAATAQTAYTHIIVTVADRTADPHGLHAADFVLLSRLPNLRALDIVASEAVLASGFHERIHDLLPGLVEERVGGAGTSPTLVAPESADDDQRWFSCRDREEELADYVRQLKHNAASSVVPPPLDRCAVVFQRPLPYLYLARQVFSDGEIPYQAVDALPLSAEPYPAAIDLVLSFLTAEGNRASTIALLSSPHFDFEVEKDDVISFDRALREIKYSGGWDRLESVAATGRASRAHMAAVAAAAALLPVRSSLFASIQLDGLLAFIRRYERPPSPDMTWHDRHARARAAVLGSIEGLRDAHAAHDDDPIELVELAATIRRWIDAQTFAPWQGSAGVRLMDATAAAYADVDDLRIVGLVERDWPAPGGRSIFYPGSILSLLGWPPEAARASAARARFRDLLSVARRRLSVSAFKLEEDSLVAPSPFVEELDTAGLPIERMPPVPAGIYFTHDALAVAMTTSLLPGSPSASWFELRRSPARSSGDRYRGTTGARPPATYAVSYVERYLDCPFKYFASQVLRLPEERDEEPGLTAQERGHFIHEVFEQFFSDWQRAGHGTITTTNVADAIEMFERVVDSNLERLPDADRALERTHLLGSAAASGLAERAFAFEIEQGGEVIERLLEHSLEGSFLFSGAEGPREVRIRAKADRIDLMASGAFRVIDYKLSRAPKLSRALQLPIYGLCASQSLEGHRGRSWTLERAGYVAFKEKDPFVPLGGRSPLATALKDGQQRFLEAIGAIERGEFPVRPDEPFKCQWCGYAGVCRKDYVGDE